MNLSPKNSPARTVFGATLPYPHQFKEAAIRQFGAASAPVYAIDKDGITQGILDGLNKSLAQMVTPAHFDWSDSVSGLEYDLDRATALIAAAGKPLKLHLTTGAFFDQRVAEAILQELQDLGFDADMVQVDTPPFCSLSRRGRQMAPPSPSARSPAHADDALSSLFHPGSSWTVAKRPEIGSLVNKAGSSSDDKRRLADSQKSLELDRQGHPHWAALPDGGNLQRSEALKFQTDAERKLLDQPHEWRWLIGL
ncbi:MULTISPECIES: ABC transporter substrate-binding protein [unclassified Rhizobium]